MSPRAAWIERLLPLWFALLAADRIDLMAGYGPFRLTPFLTITPVLAGVALHARWQQRRAVPFCDVTKRFATLLLALLVLVLTSVFVSREVATSAMRAAQLMAVAVGIAAVRLLVPTELLREGLPRGARLGIRLYVLFCALQLLALTGLIAETLPNAAMPIANLMPNLHGGLLPRLSGFVTDSNRSGLLLLVYGAVLCWHGWQRHVGTLAAAGLFLLLTLSRSSLLAAFGALAWVYWQRRGALRGSALRGGASRAAPITQAPRSRGLLALGATAAAAAMAITALLLFDQSLRRDTAPLLAPVAERFSIDEGSGEDHLRLLARGVETGSRSIGTALHGIGYGSSHVALQDFFPGDRYGNFHSVYVGLFAEVGALAVVIMALLLGVPLVMQSAQSALAVSMIVFGIFYGALAEPTYWLGITLSWLPLVAKSARPNATSSPTVMASTAPSTN